MKNVRKFCIGIILILVSLLIGLPACMPQRCDYTTGIRMPELRYHCGQPLCGGDNRWPLNDTHVLVCHRR